MKRRFKVELRERPRYLMFEAEDEDDLSRQIAALQEKSKGVGNNFENSHSNPAIVLPPTAFSTLSVVQAGRFYDVAEIVEQGGDSVEYPLRAKDL